jgi:hypothetical protein
VKAARLVLLVVAACRTEGEPARALPVVPNAAPSASVVAAATSVIPSCHPPPAARGARLVLTRSMCFGTCPDYRVEVHADGTVLFAGRAYVRAKGAARWKIPQADAERLFAIAACAGASSWKSRYTFPITDNPTAVVTVDLTPGATPIEVTDYPPCHHDTPAALCELEEAIDDLSHVAPYVQCVGADGGPTDCGW